VSPPRILVVEDDPNVRGLLRTLFDVEGYEVAVAADGLAGLLAASTQPPALILLDVMMPDLGGVRVLEEMQGNPALAAVPVIVVTGKMELLPALADLIGEANVFAKPFRAHHLLDRVSEVTGGPGLAPGQPIRLPE
jgi:DNA-binding response OmpR family regulator